MAQMIIDFEVPEHNILKLGKVFDLDTIDTDQYELIVLTDISGLNKDLLNIVDSTITSKEATTYTRPLVELTLVHDDGYKVTASAIEIILNDVTNIKGLLIVKKSSQDILASCLSMSNVVVAESFTVSPQIPLIHTKLGDN